MLSFVGVSDERIFSIIIRILCSKFCDKLDTRSCSKIMVYTKKPNSLIGLLLSIYIKYF